MSKEEITEIVEENQEPLEVKIINQPKEKSDILDEKDDVEYDELGITSDEIEEFENDGTQGK